MEQISEQILLVDDDPETMKLHSLLLRKVGFKVQSFLNSQEALSFLKFTQKNISLIISDISMPNFNGIEFLGQIKTSKKDFWILMISKEREELQFSPKIYPSNTERIKST
jgi:two-component system chemotaxis response regulator CheY